MAASVQRVLEREWIHLRYEFKRAVEARDAAADGVAEAEAAMEDFARRRVEVEQVLDGMDPAWRDDPQMKAPVTLTSVAM